ncbi:AAA family ATPase [Streptomyces sp. NPDC046915]|uniref:AAA family ATPase n=1 Tax=Streptomyces sp. NPDC046915 TaxID=3155257 RepID=UPI0033FC0B4D
MKIKRVRIENFCCLHKVDVSFEEITSFIGPTGVGKSTVLRALDWFFNGERASPSATTTSTRRPRTAASPWRWSSTGSPITTARPSGGTRPTAPRV